MKKTFAITATFGLLLCLAGLALNIDRPSPLGALFAFAGFFAVDRASGRFASKGKMGMALFCGLLFSLAAGTAGLQSAGLGLFLVILGHRFRNFFLGSLGVS